MKHELWELQSMQAAPLSVKVSLTKDRIREWVKHYGEDGVYVSFSGGKDSTVLLHLVREEYPDIPAVFVDVPTQYPELKEFAMSFDNVEILKPKMSFMQVCEKYGFPLISKEVAECVQGARKYLTSVIAEMNDLSTNERTNERYKYRYEKLCGYGEFAKANSGGGYDRKYRRLRGIGEFTGSNFKNYSQSANMGSSTQMQNWWGGAEKSFANLTGIRTSEGTVDPRLYKHYEQFASKTANGSGEQTDEGTYP